MSDKSDNSEPRGIVGAATQIGRSLISALTPEFLVLVLLNIAFLSVVMLFLDKQLERRMTLVTRIIDNCLRTTTGQ